MAPASFARLIVLAAIWGGSFLFMRMAAPSLGAAWVAEARVALAAVFLLVLALFLGRNLDLARYWRHYLILGLFNSALPFLLFAHAATTLSASLLAVLNATAPLWGAAIAMVIGRARPSLKAASGLCCGIIGVAVLVGFDANVAAGQSWWPVIAVLSASFSYGIASNYAASAPAIGSFNNAHGSMWAAALLLLPGPFLLPASEPPDATVIAAILALGVVCSGVAYLLYFRLIRDEGATSALSVTFLVPVFGVFWGWLFLNELVGWHTLVGAVVVLAGVLLVTAAPGRSR